MKITDTYTFSGATPQVVWEVLMNPDAIADALPGVEKLIPLDGEERAWRTTAKLGVAKISGTYVGVIRMTELQPPTTCRLTIHGAGQQSIISGTALLKLTIDPETQHTILSYDADAHLSGRMMGISPRLIGTAAKMLGRQFFSRLARRLPKLSGSVDAAVDRVTNDQ